MRPAMSSGMRSPRWWRPSGSNPRGRERDQIAGSMARAQRGRKIAPVLLARSSGAGARDRHDLPQRHEDQEQSRGAGTRNAPSGPVAPAGAGRAVGQRGDGTIARAMSPADRQSSAPPRAAQSWLDRRWAPFALYAFALAVLAAVAGTAHRAPVERSALRLPGRRLAARQAGHRSAAAEGRRLGQGRERAARRRLPGARAATDEPGQEGHLPHHRRRRVSHLAHRALARVDELTSASRPSPPCSCCRRPRCTGAAPTTWCRRCWWRRWSCRSRS